MDWIIFLVRDLFANFDEVLRVVLVLGIVAAIGIIFFRLLFQEERWFALIPGGIVTGTGVFILYLGVLSHIFKGPAGIRIIFLLFILSSLALLYLKRKEWKWARPAISFRWLLTTLILLLVIFVKAGNGIFGGDAITYWAFSTSFANGNYPQVLPWQPEFLTVHHQGAFLFEGAVYSISGTDIRPVHFLFAAFLIFGGFFLLWGWLLGESKRTFFSLIPSVLGYITFGAIFIVLPAIFGLVPQKTVADIPNLYDAKNALGALTSFFDLYYLIPRTVALSLIILAFLITTGRFLGGETKRLLVLAALCVVILSVDESMFAAVSLPIASWVIFRFWKTSQKKSFVASALISLVVFVLLFFVVGNPIRDSLLTPSPEAPRFRLISIDEIIKQGRVSMFSSVVIAPSQTANLLWYLPDFRILLTAVLFLSLISRAHLALLFSLSGVGATLLFLFVEHTFWPRNEARFLLEGFQFIGFSMGLVIYSLTTSKNMTKIGKLFGVILLLVIIPPTIASGLKVVKSVPSREYANFYPIGSRYQVLDWIRGNLPYNSRVFFVDGFLHGKPHSDLTLYGLESYGLFIPTGPKNFKIHTADWGPEAIDIIDTISPQALEDLGIEYLFVQTDQLPRLSVKRVADLKNSSYFEEVYADQLGRLLKVKREYWKEGQEERTIAELKNIIKGGSKIYLEVPPNLNFYRRAVLFLTLKDKGELYSTWGQGHFNYIETFIKIQDPKQAIMFDYLILGPDTSPETVCPRCRVQKIWQGGAVVWKVQQVR